MLLNDFSNSLVNDAGVNVHNPTINIGNKLTIFTVLIAVKK
jgi:hypothetical protein